MKNSYTIENLKNMPRNFDFLVGIDSDGCVFDTMVIKQKEHFHPLIIKYWQLERVEKELRVCAEFVNLTSKTRGSNRFPALLRTFELLAEYPGIRKTGVSLPDVTALRAYVQSGLPLGNPSLMQEVACTCDSELQRVLEWSLAINADIAANMRPVPPYHWARRALPLIKANSDALVVSQTPEEALVKEWREHEIDQFVDFIAGQELGTKTEHLRLAFEGRYSADCVLMIGDALGDLAAARQAGVLFYPIMPGQEEVSWEQFYEEAYTKFLAGSYDGAYGEARIQDFENALPDTPPWIR